MANKKRKTLTSVPQGKLGIIAMRGTEQFAKQVNDFISQSRKDVQYEHKDLVDFDGYQKDSYLIDVEFPRFSTGEGKAVIKETIRGYDLFIISDCFNYSVTYNMYDLRDADGNLINFPMSPDNHFADLKRVISACAGKARRITVIMPMLYEGRQHKRTMRESLDCALALQELENMGVSNIITFDAHDPRVQNAIPLHGFETVKCTYQFIKGICKYVDDIKFDNDHLMVISPDEGGTQRAVYMASVLGVDMGMFYKRRDYSKVVDGRNPIVAHEFIGASVEGKDMFIVDDMIASGESMIDVATELKKRGARRIFVIATFGLFTKGMKVFDEAVEKGIIYKVVTTNLVYQSEELLSRDYYISCGMSKYIAYIIDTLNHDASISNLLDPFDRINKLVTKYKEEHDQ